MQGRFARIIDASYRSLRDAWSRAVAEFSRDHPDAAAVAGLGDACFDSLIALWSLEPLPTPERLRQDTACPGHVLLRACVGLGRAGLSLVDAVSSVRLVFSVLEEQLDRLDWSGDELLAAWRRLHAIRDLVELSMLAAQQELEASRGHARRESPVLDADVARRQFEDLYLTSTDLVFFTDPAGRVDMANPAALGRLGHDALLGADGCAALGLAGRGNSGLQGALAPGQTTEVAVSFGDHVRHFNLRALPRAGASDGTQGLMVVMNDVTCMVDHREVLAHEVEVRTRELERSEAMLTAIVESAGEGILVADEDGEILRANGRASEIFGLAWENLVGSLILQLAEPAARPELDALLGDLSLGELRQLEVTGVYVDGRRFPAALTATRFDMDDRRYVAFLVRDVSVPKRLEQQMRDERAQSEEMNVTLRNVLKSIENDRRETQQQLAIRIRDAILPALAKVRGLRSAATRASFLDLVEEQLIALTSGTSGALDGGLLRLSRTELEVARLIQGGVSSKAIAEALSLSLETVQTHRKNIRRKLGLQGRRVNLHNYLTARPSIRGPGGFDVER